MDPREAALIAKLDGFLTITLDTSADAIVEAKRRELPLVLKKGGLQLIDPLDEGKWKDFCSKVTINFDNKKSEDEGIHPTVREIFEICEKQSNLNTYIIKFEKNLEDIQQGLLKRPDIFIMLQVDLGYKIESVVLPGEIKKFNDLNSAIHQAALSAAASGGVAFVSKLQRCAVQESSDYRYTKCFRPISTEIII